MERNSEVTACAALEGAEKAVCAANSDLSG
jgi:hypothetical protein